MDRTRLLDLVEASDFDGLIRLIDGLCAARDWDAMLEVRERCVQAESRGKQLWGIVQFVDYRQALEAPAERAARVVVDGAGRFALGPLWEVAASTHTWAELEPYVESTRMRALVAAERVLRGEVVTGDLDLEVLGTPFALMPWEPGYSPAVYRSDRADFPAPDPIHLEPLPGVPEPQVADDPDSEDALFGLIRTWVEESNGIAHVATVAGDAVAAIATVSSVPTDGSRIGFADALALMAWAGANGGAHGSRRGGAVGRSAAWAAVAALADLEWPSDPAELGAAGAGLNWWRFQPRRQIGGWQLGLAASDPQEGLAWAISGRDMLDESSTHAAGS